MFSYLDDENETISLSTDADVRELLELTLSGISFTPRVTFFDPGHTNEPKLWKIKVLCLNVRWVFLLFFSLIRFLINRLVRIADVLPWSRNWT